MEEDYRAKKSGIALKIEKKMEERYDLADSLGTPTRLMVWLSSALNGHHQPCPSDTWRNIHFYLRDGVALCKLVNRVLEADGSPPIKFQKNATTAFIAMENIETFNKGAKQYGLPDPDLFNSIDLYEGHKGPMMNVINCLNKLGFKANSKGFEPQYEAIEAPDRDAELWANT